MGSIKIICWERPGGGAKKEVRAWGTIGGSYKNDLSIENPEKPWKYVRVRIDVRHYRYPVGCMEKEDDCGGGGKI